MNEEQRDDDARYVDDEDDRFRDEGDAGDQEPQEGELLPAGEDAGQGPDVLLDVPQLEVDEIHLDVEDLRARVSLQAEVLDLLKLNVGADVDLGRVQLEIKGVEAQALLKVRLDNVARIIDRVLRSVDKNPQILEAVTRGVGAAAQELGGGARQAVGELGHGAGEATKSVGAGAGNAVQDVGGGAGDAVRDVGGGAGDAVQDVGAGAGGAVQDAGAGAGEAIQDVGQGARESAEVVGEEAGDAVGKATRGDVVGKATRGGEETARQPDASTGSASDGKEDSGRRTERRAKRTASKRTAERGDGERRREPP
ncbi:hypothetical protein [Streptomyces reniochalinae]|uniref:hypothetical protein n=1 Tax=Streptomyces reniochalinae TaxID=2250578 RepID=UPI0015EFF5D9|nr:hypothetical protein [Streptomyces reniochalinae]